MKKLLLLSFLSLSCFTTMQSQTTAAAKAQGVGANVSIRGVVINGSELGYIRYIQDYTGGMAAYGSPVTSLNRGDSVLISGPLTEYYNLFEIAPPVVTLISTNATVPTPSVITPAQFGEPQEGMLIKIMNCSFSATGNFSPTPGNYTVTSNSQTFAVRSSSIVGGTPIPTGTVNITGIGSQFCGPQSSSGCTKGYQLLLRTTADLSTGTTATVTGIDNVNSYASVSVFPNPASQSISFRLSGAEQPVFTVITDVVGKVVLSSTENTTRIDISSLSKGFYNLRISTEKNNYKTKFIVE